MTNTAVTVLLVAGEQDVEPLVRRALDATPWLGYSLGAVGSLADAMESASSSSSNVLLVCLDLPDSAGIETLARLRSRFPDIAMVVVVDDDRGDGPEMVRLGAQDYLLYSELGEPR